LEPWQNLTKDASYIVDGWLGASHIAVNGKQAAMLNPVTKSEIRTDTGIGIDELKNSGQWNDGREAELRPIQSEFNKAIQGQRHIETRRQQ
jgi:hypothetical protein